MTLAILLTCFNRKDVTVNCLHALVNQKKLDDVIYDIYLVDDGCTDGTNKAVSTLFPEVKIIKGNGTFFWNGGMRLAWREALISNYDFYLWVNDDSFIYTDAISNLLNTYEQLIEREQEVGVIIGSMVDRLSNTLTYGGRLKAAGMNPLKMGTILKPEEIPIKCDFVNGNLTLVPRKTVEAIGILSDRFTHSMGDFDYGLRASSAGLGCWVAPGIYGECQVNSIDGSWQDSSLDINERTKKMKSITQLPPVNEWKYFIRQHGGAVWPLLYFDAWLRGQFPKLWLILKRKN